MSLTKVKGYFYNNEGDLIESYIGHLNLDDMDGEGVQVVDGDQNNNQAAAAGTGGGVIDLDDIDDDDDDGGNMFAEKKVEEEK